LLGASVASWHGVGVGFVSALLVTIAISAPAQTAPGQERLATAAFAVARDPSGQKAAAAIAAVLSDRVARHGRLRLIEPGRALSGDPRTREEETLLRARTALADGRRAYDALNLDEAIARLGQAEALYQTTGPLLGDLSELTTTLAYLGAALTLRGSTDEGVTTFVSLLTIDPTYSPDGFPPTVTRIFERALQRLSQSAKGTIEIYSTPPYSTVYVDGRFRGVTPLTLSDLYSGTHYLRIEQNGYVVHGAPIEIAPNQRITSQTRLQSVKSGAELRDLLSRASREALQEGMGPSTRSLARMLVAETFLLVSVSQSGKDVTLTGAAYDAGSATKLTTERAVIDAEGPAFLKDVGALADKLLASLSTGSSAGAVAGGQEGGGGGFGLGVGQGAGVQQQPAGGGAPPPGPSGYASAQRDDGSPPAGTVVGWLMVGVGVIGVGTGVVFAILAKKTHDDYLLTAQASDQLPQIRDDGKTRALIADLGMFGGAAFVVGGVVTLLLTAKSSDAPEEILAGIPSIAPIEGGAMVTYGGRFW
jgi:hypothetical protein